MSRLHRFAIVTSAALLLVACGSSKSQNPAAPTPAPAPAPGAGTPTVTAVTVSGGPAASATTFQLTATAKLSNNSTQDVTSTASWASSNTQIATVSSSGMVTIVGSGDVDLRATYQGVTGSLHQTLSAPKPTTYSLKGTVMEAAPNARPVTGARVQLIVGDHTFTDTNGAFTLSGLPPGKVIVEFSKDGYQVRETETTIVDRDVQLPMTLYPTPPTNSDGATATARCNDGSWSWAQTRADACTANGGIAYGVCPGPFCTGQ